MTIQPTLLKIRDLIGIYREIYRGKSRKNIRHVSFPFCLFFFMAVLDFLTSTTGLIFEFRAGWWSREFVGPSLLKIRNILGICRESYVFIGTLYAFYLYISIFFVYLISVLVVLGRSRIDSK